MFLINNFKKHELEDDSARALHLQVSKQSDAIRARQKRASFCCPLKGVFRVARESWKRARQPPLS